jgi:uncharacterized protein
MIRIDIAGLVKVDGASLDIDVQEMPEELENLYAGVVFKEAPVIKGTLVNIGGVLKLTGSICVSYSCSCDRCLQHIDSFMSIDVDEEYVKNSGEHEGYEYGDNFITLDEMIIDNIGVSMPMIHLCDAMCKGLCPVCGSNLNEHKCNCSHKQNENASAFSVLKDFFSK